MKRSQIAAQLLAPLLIALACWTLVGNIAGFAVAVSLCNLLFG